MKSSGRKSWFGVLPLLLFVASCDTSVINIEEPAEVETCEWLVPVGIELVNDYVYTLLEMDLGETRGNIDELPQVLVELNERGEELDARAEFLECDVRQLNQSIAEATSGIEFEDPAVATVLEALRGGVAATLDPAHGDWVLKSGAVAESAIAPVEDHPITLMIDDVAASGFGGCNGFYYPIEMTDGLWAWDEGAATITELLCLDDSGDAMADVMAAEAGFINVFKAVNGYTIEAEMLVLTGPGVELRFERQVSAGDSP